MYPWEQKEIDNREVIIIKFLSFSYVINLPFRIWIAFSKIYMGLEELFSD